MFRFITTAITALFLAGAAHATCTGPGAEALFTPSEIVNLRAEAHTAPYSDGVYWKATKGDRTIHVAGTVHLFDPRLDDMFSRFEDQLNKADVLLLELNQNDQTAMETELATNPQFFVLPDGQSMPEVLRPETWDATANALAGIGINPADVAPLQPWFLSINLAIAPCAIASLQAGQVGMDTMLENALPEGVPAMSLETWQGSLSFFTGPSFEEQAQELLLNIATYAHVDTLTVATLNAYFDEEPYFIWEVTRALGQTLPPEQAAQYAAYMERLEDELLTERNAGWMDVIQAASAEHPSVFVAVGAMHLGGETGVLKLLEAKGWTVTKM